MHVSVSGSGPPLVLLHGLLGGSFCWRFNVREFASARTTYAIDMAGMGVSVAPRKTDCGMRSQAERVAAFLESQALHDVDLVGSSWGGGVAMLLAAGNSPIRSLVAVAPVNPWSDFGSERVRFFAGRFGSMLVHCGLPFARRLHEIGVQRMYGEITRIRPGTLEGYSALLRRPGLSGSLINILRNWEGDVDALRTAIPRIKAPTLLIWGSCDGAVDPRSAEALEKALPQARTAVLPGVGHLPFEESPEVFNRLVLDFIEHPA
jgi:4,5:9,10-diseco-3-hydroxy-5,9,17-trioxoandrosta-1(10),2-diene-4-oate hydrolase